MTASIIKDLLPLLQQLNGEHYTYQSSHLSNATIGQHIRHSIEMYQCLVNGYEQGMVDYSKRKRDVSVETSPNHALENWEAILHQLPTNDKQILVIDNDELVVSSYKRELLYCNEHLIHHMALIKVAVLEIGNYLLPATFGIAPSTIKYMQQCAQ